MNRIYKIYFPLIALLLLGYTAKINWGNNQWQSVMEGDAKGYYAYLPAVFIYQDLNFGFFEEAEVQKAYDPNLVYDYRSYPDGKIINKYYAGEAVLLTPFFLTAHVLSKTFDFPPDGYSQLYVIAVTIAAIFYLIIGLIALKKALKTLGFNDNTIYLSLTIIVFGTNLFYYTVGEPGMSHVYSFSMISLFIFQVCQYFAKLKLRHVLYASFFLGIIILIRPINLLVLLSVPFLSQNKEQFLKGLKMYLRNYRIFIASVAIIFLVVFIQPIIYKFQTGSFFVYSYGEEGFNFGSPAILDFLFSYKKGFFLYTPVCLVALMGFWFLRKNKYLFFTLLGFLAITIYVLSSWWNWYYGGSFSSRVMVDYLPYFVILISILFQGIRNKVLRIAYLIIIGILMMVNQIQTLQYRYYIIHWSEMNKEKYWDNFLNLRPVIERKNQLKNDSGKKEDLDSLKETSKV